MKKRKFYLTAAVLLLALLVSGVTAYLNDSETAQDRITLSDGLKIELIEPNFRPQSLSNVQPRQVIQKDPRIVNKSKFGVYAFMEVVVPYLDDLVVQDDAGRIVNESGKGGALYGFTPKPGWSLVKNPSLTLLPNGEKGVSHVYAWMSNDVLTILKAGETTGPLFETVEVENYVNGRGLESARNITVNAYGIDASISADNEPATPRTPQSIWALLKNTYPSPTPSAQPAK